jgi:GTPase SAR1 family protein
MDALRNFFSSKQEARKNMESTNFKLCFIGKTKTGKSSTINALRGLYKSDPGYATTSSSLLSCTSGFIEYDFSRDGNTYNITLVDTEGINNDNVNAQTIKELVNKYDGIVFVTNEAFLKEDLNLLQDLDQKPFVLYFVRTHFDSTLQAELNNTKYENRQEDAEELVIKEKTIESVRCNMKRVLHESSISRIVTEKSLYLITSTTKDFEQSPDGRRFLADLVCLENLKKNDKISLAAPASYQLIRYRRNYLKLKLWESLLVVGASSISSIIPFLDTLFGKLIIENKKDHWFQLFGIQELLDLKGRSELDSLGLPEDRLRELEAKLNEIETERGFFDLDRFRSIFKSRRGGDTDEKEDKSDWYEELKRFYTDGNVTSFLLKLLTVGGAGAARVLEFTFKTIGKGLLVTIPIFCSIYIYITYNSLGKMIDLCESHAFQIYSILHN